MKTVLTNCTVIDCTGKPPLTDMTVVVEGETIVELKPGLYQEAAVEGQVRIFDLDGGYVLPGLWDVHVHLGGLFSQIKRLKHRLLTESPIDPVIRAGRIAMDALRAGVTGIRVVGERDFVDVAWKRAFDAGIFVGPRLFVCGEPIHTSVGNLAAGANGPYEMRKAARERLKRGVDQIKLMVTAGHAEMIASGVGESMQECWFLLDEVKAATEVAHLKGKKVCAHASHSGIKMVIRAGVDCIEHGYYLDDEAVEMMVENDVFYVPTLVCNLDGEWLNETGMIDPVPGYAKRAFEGRDLVAKAEGVTPEYVKVHREGFQKALKAGVKIACGSDKAPGEYLVAEIEHLVRAGMTEMQALVSATRTSADVCGVVDQLGTVEVGKLADLIVVSEDPLENISNLRQLKLVFKGGNLVETKESEGVADYWELFFF